MEHKEILKQKWFFKRKMTTIIGMMHLCCYYFEYTSVVISALYYYKNVIKAENPKFFIGLSMASILVAGLISSYVCGRIMDKTRNLRAIGLIALLCGIFGNLVYCLSSSPWFPVIGRLLCGTNGSLRLIIAGKSYM